MFWLSTISNLFTEKDKNSRRVFPYFFNELHRANKQIILSSDRVPSSIPTLTDRLKSRLKVEWLSIFSCPISKLVKASLKLEQNIIDNVKLDPEVSEFIAENYRTNIREIIGAVTQPM